LDQVGYIGGTKREGEVMVRRKHIRAVVEKLLSDNRIRSAPVSASDIASHLGVEVQLEAADDELSGFLYRNRNRDQAIIGVNALHHPNRQNFTTAHELGHFLLHEFDDIHVDRQFRVWLRSEASSQGTDLEEKEANLFAAELLMPEKFLVKDVQTIGTVDVLDEDVIKRIAEKYEVSTQAMTFRLAYLGYVQQ
jgi:Zn-dependent peptidase ImmA (M78 family)